MHWIVPPLQEGEVALAAGAAWRAFFRPDPLSRGGDRHARFWRLNAGFSRKRPSALFPESRRHSAYRAHRRREPVVLRRPQGSAHEDGFVAPAHGARLGREGGEVKFLRAGIRRYASRIARRDVA